jgi:hypothetical protein
MLHSSCKTNSRMSFRFGNSTHLCCSVSSHNAGAMFPKLVWIADGKQFVLGKTNYRKRRWKNTNEVDEEREVPGLVEWTCAAVSDLLSVETMRGAHRNFERACQDLVKNE